MKFVIWFEKQRKMKYMKILLFGISNVGKSTIGKTLSEKLHYAYDDTDDEIKRRYTKIDTFKEKFPDDYYRHKKREEILLDIINKYDDNVVIAVSPIFYEELLVSVLVQSNVIAIELQDEPENILKRLVYTDKDDNVYPLLIKTKKEIKYYLKEIKADIQYYKKVYKKIENKFNMEGETPQEVTNKLIEYIRQLNIK